MLSRVVALILATVLTWSGFATPERAFAFAANGAEQVVSCAAGEPIQRGDGDVLDDEHLTDLAGQVQVEGAMDLPAIHTPLFEAKGPALSMSRPRPYSMAAWLAPYLDGPQRPPRTRPLVA